MLAWMKRYGEAASSEPVEHQRREPDEDGADYDEMEAVAEDLLRAFKSDHVKGIAEALHAAFEIYDSKPHVEGPHLKE